LSGMRLSSIGRLMSGNRGHMRPRSAGTGILLCLLASFLAVPQGAGAQEDPLREILRFRCEQLRQTGGFQIGSAEIAAVAALPHFYEMRDFEPAWIEPEDVQSYLSAAQEAYRDGLDPEDYHLSAAKGLLAGMSAAGAATREDQADLEMLLTDGFFRLVYHMEFGKVDPVRLDPSWNIFKDFGEEDPAMWLETALASPSLFDFVESKKSQHPLYACLKATLEKYRAIEESGGWEPVPPGRTLKKGMGDDRVVNLRVRLRIAGDLPDTLPTASRLFDDDVEAAVMRFQERYGLEVDGAVGRGTLEAMNVPVEDRVDQLKVNLERGRWVLHDLNDTFILVNIAGFRVFYVKDNRIEWATRAQVGTPYRQTPVFKAQMDYIVFNPTWTVPPTILAQDVLPAVKGDIGYLAVKNMTVLDRGGKRVDANGIDWGRYTGSSFPYVIRQEPGPENALGRLKFIFPNEHFIFLHDTPSKALFDKSERTFSSGCIRVENALELAGLLLAGQEGWDAAGIEKVIAEGKTQTAYLAKPLPTLLLYWTAFSTQEGGCNFRNDVYRRDPAVLQALAEKPAVRIRHETQRDRVPGSH
jgi:murein L,D-transpeptidase YcbB/YkuD